MQRPPLPPFDIIAARQKIRAAENAWNSRDPDIVTPAYTENSIWRNRDRFLTGHREIHAFLVAKWHQEIDYRLIKELWAHSDNRIAVRFAYEWRNAYGDWFRSYGNENWEFAADGRMRLRLASINDRAIAAPDRLFHWDHGPRPDDHPDLTGLGL